MVDPLTSLLIALLLSAFGAGLFWPERGLIPRWQRNRQMTERVLIEDALNHIHRCGRKNHQPTVQSIAGALSVSANRAASLLEKMAALDLIAMPEAEISLTSAGRDYALRIIRAHRLWESYLAEETGYKPGEWHDLAHRYEHNLSPEEMDALSARLGNPSRDPHGDPIPTAGGKMVSHGGQPLNAMPLDQPLRIVHLEDEPEAVYAQLIAEGLYPGMVIRQTEATPQRVRFWADGEEHILAPIVAANLSVVPLAESEPTEPEKPPGERLSTLAPGEQARVLGLSPVLRGMERRRLMDLGILPGTIVVAELRSASGDPTAYRIRGAMIALRKEQANLINISRIEDISI